MFDNTAIQIAFSGLVGFRQSANVLYTSLDASLKVQDSGLCFNDLSAIDFEVIEYIIGSDYANVNDYLNQVYSGCVSQMLNKFISQNKSKWSLKEVLENTTVFNEPSKKEPYIQAGRARGYEIKPYKSNNIRCEITHLGIFGDSDQEITVYFYRSNKKAPISSIKIAALENEETWTAVSDMINFYQSQTEGAGQSLYLLFYEYDSSNPLPEIQLTQNAKMYQDKFCKSIKYATITPVMFENKDLNYNIDAGLYDLPNIENVSYPSLYQGLNFRIKLNSDLTHLLLDQKLIFAEALQYMVAIKLLWDGVASTNLNPNVLRKEADWIKFANKYEAYLYGYNDEKLGFVKGVFDKLGFDISNLDKICLPNIKSEPGTARIPYA